MQAAPVPAPETKAAETTGDVAGAFEEFMRTFEAFKAENDSRLAVIEQKRVADVLTVEKVDRINRALDEQKRLMDSLVLKTRRPLLGRDGGPLSAETIEHKAAFEAYVRGGAEEALRGIERKALSVAADGGYLVPDETEREIGRRLSAASPIRAIAGVRQVSGNTYKKPFVIAGAATGWVGETDSRPQTNAPTLSELEFPTMELYAMPAATATLLDDSAVNIDEWLAGEVETVFAEQEGTAFVTGDGDKKPTGFLSYTTIAETSWAWEKIGYVATGVDGAWPAATPSDILVDLVYALKAGYRQNGTWVMNRASQAAIRKMKDDSDNYIWQPAAVAGQPASLMNFPIAESEDMPDIGSGAFAIAFGDFRRGYLIVDRVGVRVLRDPYSAKPYVLFYTTKRVGGGVQDYDAIKLLKFGTA
jgi:HK97 family phage major capsid protein